MAYRTFSDENLMKLLGQALSASYTGTYTKALGKNERIVYLVIGHTSVDVTIDIKIASDSSGTGAASVLDAAVTADTAGLIWTVEIDAAQLTEAKRFVSPVITLTAGTYTLIELKRGLRNQGNLTQDSTYTSATEKLG